MQFRKSLMLGATVAGLLTTGYAVAQEQYIGLPSYRVGAYAAGGTALTAGGSITCRCSISVTAA
jgi:branched-chain amino acid transport system substrate-binding protein